MINGAEDILARHPLGALGDAEAVLTEKCQSLEKMSGIGDSIIAEARRMDVLLRTEKELAFAQKNGTSIHFLKDMNYLERLRERPGTPVLFYLRGNVGLNAAYIISVVGTRRASAYGQEVIERLLRDLSVILPDLLIVSGLACSIDICAHRSTLKNRLPTMGVLAYGSDYTYPPVHRPVAVKILERGGLLTDFPSGTNSDRQDFIRRNRAIAGLADITTVVELAEKRDSLITVNVAFSYGRDIYAFPGRVTDINSKGCNSLIRQNKEGLVTCADDLIMAMCQDAVQKTDALPV